MNLCFPLIKNIQLGSGQKGSWEKYNFFIFCIEHISAVIILKQNKREGKLGKLAISFKTAHFLEALHTLAAINITEPSHSNHIQRNRTEINATSKSICLPLQSVYRSVKICTFMTSIVHIFSMQKGCYKEKRADDNNCIVCIVL